MVQAAATPRGLSPSALPLPAKASPRTNAVIKLSRIRACDRKICLALLFEYATSQPTMVEGPSRSAIRQVSRFGTWTYHISVVVGFAALYDVRESADKVTADRARNCNRLAISRSLPST